MGVAVNMFKLGAVSCGVGFLGVGRCAKHCHDVELSSMAQGIMNDVVARPTPQQDAVTRNVNF